MTSRRGMVRLVVVCGVLSGPGLLAAAGGKPAEDDAMKNRSGFSLARRDEEMMELAARADHRTLAIWARDCAGRVLPYFEAARPADPRPRQALDALQAWIDTGVFKMAVIRKASLSSHAAAREVGEDNAARSAARAAGQAVATAHVRTHAPGAPMYARQARSRAADPAGADAAVAAERGWQLAHLRELMEKK